jgi:hypothetical protein
VIQKEEHVRQSLIRLLVEELGFPRQWIAVEKELSSLPHVGEAVNRRVDILCFASDGTPLLLIECKREKLDASAFQQLVGYNAIVKAPFVAVANGEEMRVAILKHHGYEPFPHAPTYTTLIAQRVF